MYVTVFPILPTTLPRRCIMRRLAFLGTLVFAALLSVATPGSAIPAPDDDPQPDDLVPGQWVTVAPAPDGLVRTRVPVTLRLPERTPHRTDPRLQQLYL